MNTDMYTADCIAKVQPEHMQENAIGHFIANVSLKQVRLTSDSNICCICAVNMAGLQHTEADNGSAEAINVPYCYKQSQPNNVTRTNHDSTVLAEHM